MNKRFSKDALREYCNDMAERLVKKQGFDTSTGTAQLCKEQYAWADMERAIDYGQICAYESIAADAYDGAIEGGRDD